jgi:repressor LexA
VDKNQNANKADLYSGNRHTVGDRLKEYMQQHSLKQVDIIEKARPFFTEKLKITKTDLSQYINNKTEPRSDKLHLLAKALNVDEAWLLGFDKDRNSNKDNNDLGNKKVMADNIKHYLKRNGITRKKLSSDLDISYTTLASWLQADSYPRIDKIEMMANYFGVSKADLVEKHYSPSNSIDTSGMHYVRVPIIGTIACGKPILAEQNIEGYTHELFEEEPKKDELFALRCQGDSMEPLIPDGALVLIHKQPTVEDDEIAAVQVDDDTKATLKKVKHVGKDVFLYPINTKYDPIILNEDNPGRILGKAIHVGFDM